MYGFIHPLIYFYTWIVQNSCINENDFWKL